MERLSARFNVGKGARKFALLPAHRPQGRIQKIQKEGAENIFGERATSLHTHNT